MVSVTLVFCYFRLEVETKISECDTELPIRGFQTGHLYSWLGDPWRALEKAVMHTCHPWSTLALLWAWLRVCLMRQQTWSDLPFTEDFYFLVIWQHFCEEMLRRM